MHRLFEAVQQDRTQVPLLQSALWFVGEYGDLLADSYDDDASVKRRVGRKKEVLLKPVHYDGVEWATLLAALTSIAEDEAVSNESRMMLLTALLKLTDRFGSDVVPEVKALLAQWRDSTDIELQQRANEYFALLGEDEQVVEPLLEQMPPLDIDTAKMLRKENELQEEESDDSEEEYEESEEEEESAEEEESGGEDAYADLLGLDDSSKPSTPSPQTPSPQTPAEASTETPAEASAETPAEVPSQTPSQTVAEAGELTVTAFENHGITVVFQERAGATRGEVIIRVTVTNANAVDAEGLSLQLSVPRYIQLQMKPLSADVVPANGQGTCSQMFRVRNNAIEEKNTVVKLRVVCQIGAEAVDEVVLVDQFIGNESCVYYESYHDNEYYTTIRQSQVLCCVSLNMSILLQFIDNSHIIT